MLQWRFRNFIGRFLCIWALNCSEIGFATILLLRFISIRPFLTFFANTVNKQWNFSGDVRKINKMLQKQPARAVPQNCCSAFPGRSDIYDVSKYYEEQLNFIGSVISWNSGSSIFCGTAEFSSWVFFLSAEQLNFPAKGTAQSSSLLFQLKVLRGTALISRKYNVSNAEQLAFCRKQ